MKHELLNICNQLVTATANSVYQGTVIAVLVALCLRWAVKTNAATRHAVWFSALLLLTALVIAHGWIGLSPRQSAPSGKVAAGWNRQPVMPQAEAIPASDTAIADASLVPADLDANFFTVSEGQSKSAHPVPVTVTRTAPESDQTVAAPEETQQFEFPAAQNDATKAPISSAAATSRTLTERLLNPVSVQLTVDSRFSALTSTLLVLWLIIAGVRVLGLMLQLVRIRRMKHQSLSAGGELSELFDRLTSRRFTNREVQLRLSSTHRSSFLLGFLHPVVLVPAQERLGLAEAEMVLRHELAHLERRDDWVNLIQHFVLAVFFFHPAFWWISKQLSLEREIACDDHVLQQSKRPQAYALLLTDLAARMQKQLPLLAPGSSNNKTQLKERIDMILNTHRNASPRLAKTSLALIASTTAIVAAAIVFTAPRIVLAQIDTTTPDVPPARPVQGLPAAAANAGLPVAAVAGLPRPGSAENSLPMAGSIATVSPGPKFKPASPVTVTTSPTVIAAPDISLAPVQTRLSVTAFVPGQPPSIIAALEPPSKPLSPRPPSKSVRASVSENQDSSLEERLDRLERMVNSLISQQNQKNNSDFQLKLERYGIMDRKDKIDGSARQQAELAGKPSQEEIERIKQKATRDARQAVEQAKRANAEAGKVKATQKEAVQKLKADSQRQLEDLRRQIESLERQREKLDREIERLEHDQEGVAEQETPRPVLTPH